jgi:hypothetical protein
VDNFVEKWLKNSTNARQLRPRADCTQNDQFLTD